MGARVLEGRWEFRNPHFEDGIHPTVWVNSQDILRKFERSNKIVKYGQCWVFAAIYQTCCRALGIPSRIITNYQTVVDENANLKQDIYMDQYNRFIQQESSWYESL